MPAKGVGTTPVRIVSIRSIRPLALLCVAFAGPAHAEHAVRVEMGYVQLAAGERSASGARGTLGYEFYFTTYIGLTLSVDALRLDDDSWGVSASVAALYVIDVSRARLYATAGAMGLWAEQPRSDSPSTPATTGLLPFAGGGLEFALDRRNALGVAFRSEFAQIQAEPQVLHAGLTYRVRWGN